MSKIIVTGGLGYIGSHTTVDLLQNDHHVVILDNLSNSKREVLESIKELGSDKVDFVELDITDRSILFDHKSLLANTDAIIHFAALKAVGESVEKPLKYYHTNILGLLNILEFAQDLQINNFVFSSSSTVYGQPDILPVTEKSAIKPPQSPYGATKQISEQILKDFSKVHEGFNCVALRYFNPIGAHSSAKIGELPLGTPNNLMPFITQTAIGIREELSVFGDDYQTPDGTGIRDYIHVVDLADAHVCAIKRLLAKESADPFEVYNIGTGKGYSVLEVIKSFEKTSGVRLKYKVVDRRQGDIAEVYADVSHAKNVLNWEAKLSLDEMTESAWIWEKGLSKEKTKMK